MGEIADMILDGTLDFYTGEYLGKGHGIPRTKNKSLEWEKRKKKAVKTGDFTAENSYNGIKKYVEKIWSGCKIRPSIRDLIREYTGETGFDLKKACHEVQNDWPMFKKWLTDKRKAGN
jgi:hypothetical protein